MAIFRVPIGVGFVCWAYAFYRLGTIVLGNSLTLHDLFGSIMIAAILTFMGFALAGLWVWVGQQQKRT